MARQPLVIYPRYLDAQATCADGRRFPAAECVPRPTVEDIREAIAKVHPDCSVEVQEAARYCRGAVEDEELGRVLAQAPEGQTKRSFVRSILPALRELRAEQEERRRAEEELEREEQAKRAQAQGQRPKQGSSGGAKRGGTRGGKRRR